MGPPVRTVCTVCLHSLEISSSGEGLAEPATCPHCGHDVDPARLGSDTSTTGDVFSPPPDPDALTPKAVSVGQPMPARIGRFVLREPLGEGGYGTVYRAYDPHLDRDVALKVLKPTRLGEKALERFLREARAAARLDHPNIVTLHDAGRDDQRCWIAYQLVPGVTLSMFRDVDRPSIDESVRIVRDLARALEHAHGRRVYHRDLKPANVLIDESGRARLTDFGLARRIDLGSDLTQEGTILGTPQYMSPEAAKGLAFMADGRSDVYSLGVILYELICGKRPSNVPSGAPLWQSTKIVTPPTPRSVDRQIPLVLDRISMKAIEYDPDDRYPDARSFAESLDHYLEGRPIPTPRRSPGRGSSRKGGFIIGLIVAASVLCLALAGIGLHVATGPADVGPGLTADSPLLGKFPPPPPDATSEPNVGKSTQAVAGLTGPVAVRSKQSRIYHLAGCSSTNTITEEHYEVFPFPDDEAIKAGKLKPCTRCEPTLEKARERASSGPWPKAR